MISEGRDESRSVIDHGQGQSGDQRYRDTAGRDVTTTNNQGADFGEVLAFLKEYTYAADQVRETTTKEVRAELGAVRAQLEKRERYATDEARIASEALTSLRGQLERLGDRVQDLVADAAEEKAERRRQEAEEKEARIKGQEARAAMDAQIAAALTSVRRRVFWHSIIIGALVVALALVAFG